ncbi:flagellar biosynthetic protein FliR [Anaerobranca gottschalkii]|uniref:Flagellar biosynthetic protein FliR n=1 Tax=Anaerobranca gottschalkii DSM 13577 TaxID=1120990 RepID=A0A1H9ZEQ1_9FIRM|nr:flagellar biosynthetic protein FliR [Anaerobranca gottschalkii]SES79311.1 flagellar biosynthetic protein FliR [Anaerobranca gottschalkii DSM 13577]
MELYNIINDHFYTFILLTVRFTGLYLGSPIFGGRNIPNQVKIALALICSLIITPLHSVGITIEQIDLSIILLGIKELVVGLVIGYIAMLTFTAIQFAGQFIDVQMGFGIVNVVDPQFGNPIPIIGNFKYIIAILLFLTVNGHHLLIDALFKSIELVPIGTITFGDNVIIYIFGLFVRLFLISLQVGLPIIGTLFIVDVGLGIVARTVPQMNVFVVGIPLKILVGFTIIIMIFPLYIRMLLSLFEVLHANIYKFIQILGG